MTINQKESLTLPQLGQSPPRLGLLPFDKSGLRSFSITIWPGIKEWPGKKDRLFAF